MKKSPQEDQHDMRREFVRSGCVATVWVVFYILIATHALSGPSRSPTSPTSAEVVAPNLREVIAEVSRAQNAAALGSSNALGK